MKLRVSNKLEFEKWFEESCQRHAEDRAFLNQTTPEEERVNVDKMTEAMLPEGMSTNNHYFYSMYDETNHNVGFIWFGKLPDIGDDEIILLDIMIGESYRKQGYGRKLLTLGQDKMKEKGYKRVLLNVMERNFAKFLYESLGYKTVKQLDGHKIMILDI